MFDKILDQINAKFGKGTATILASNTKVDVEVISTGSLALDIALGIGGLPRGRIVEAMGPESSGKTTIAIQTIASAQKQGHGCAFIDVEHAFDKSYAESLGVDTTKLLFVQPDSAEQALDIMSMLVKSGEFAVVVLDSVAALSPQAELDGEMGESKMGLVARLMSQAMRKMTADISRSQTTAIFINQIRMKIGVLFGSPETTTGGEALKFYASIRLDVRRQGGGVKDKDGDRVANEIKVKVIKNKLAPPFREAVTRITFGKGIDLSSEVIDLGVAYGLLKKSGAWYATNTGEKLANGKEATIQFFDDNPEYRDVIARQIMDAAFGGAQVEEHDDE